MRVLICTWGHASHLFPMVPLAWALTTAGHEVRVAAQPSLSPAVERAGLCGVEVGGEFDLHDFYRRRVANLVSGRPEGRGATLDHDPAMVGAFAEAAKSMVDDLLPLARGWRPDLVVYDSTTFAAPVLAALCDLPAVRFVAQPDYFFHKSTSDSSGTGGGPLSRLFAAYGLENRKILDGPAFDTCPPSLQIDTTYPRIGTRFVPYNGSGIAPAWVHVPPPRPRICVTWGTTVASAGQRLFPVEAVTEAAAELDAEVVLAVSPQDKDMVEHLRDRVRVCFSLPIGLLMPGTDVLVGGGGGGAMMTAVSHGVPQLHVPQIADMPFNAAQLAGTGAGLVLERDDVTAESVRDRLAELLRRDSPHRRAAAALRAESEAQPSLAEAVHSLVEYAVRKGDR
ncbi:nucleotide disphospho-sugar-binding domain-containing protein [Amycolatopsis vastitatis]|uniref:Uncharacterized protein n=1 Tax=Amycolatopsis vastitatis TaxID=1905142 RepID=A0A229TF80_9PSEU|nr:nucleotide disphospho-sugar-binding domain-containing protein [Amycolatopsis vastitatis]OXM69793.1 hypothetical protein CF165_09855 [Amycolatopsis vastitatis]